MWVEGKLPVRAMTAEGAALIDEVKIASARPRAVRNVEQRLFRSLQPPEIRHWAGRMCIEIASSGGISSQTL